MKTMKIEKELSLAHAVKELQRISVREGLQYKKEEDGIRAIGPLYVLGSYLDMQDRTQTIREMIDMDVFAPAQKLSQEDFVITIGEVIPQARQQQLALSMCRKKRCHRRRRVRQRSMRRRKRCRQRKAMR